MTNTNYLKNIRCPACGNEGRFLIAVTVWANLTDDAAAVADDQGRFGWNDDIKTRCPGCSKEGRLAEFDLEEEEFTSGTNKSSPDEVQSCIARQAMPDATTKPFDNYEISPCTRTEEPDRPGHFYFEVCEPAEADVWTIYGHIPGEGVQAIADFATEAEAEDLYQRITGEPFGSHKEVGDRLRLMHAAPKLLDALVNLRRSILVHSSMNAGLAVKREIQAASNAIAVAQQAFGLNQQINSLGDSSFRNERPLRFAEAKHRILITVEGGVIQHIENIPPDTVVEVRDFDKDGDRTHPSWSEEHGAFVSVWEGPQPEAQTATQSPQRVADSIPPDPDGMNDDRSEWAGKAIAAFREVTGCDEGEEALGDLLADLMHWADRHGLDFGLELDQARAHYEAETMGEAA